MSNSPPGDSDPASKAATADSASFHTSAFEQLESDFRKVLDELVGDKSLERFRHEYEKLHHALKKSHENEKRLIHKCRELNSEIVANAAKVSTAMRLSQEDQNSIALLKKEIDKAWKMVDAAHEKEKRSKRTIQHLKAEIQNLSRLVDQGAGLSIGQENTVNELLKVREDLERERERDKATVAAQASEIARCQAEMASLQSQGNEEREKSDELQSEKESMEQQAAREKRRADRMQQEMMGIKSMSDARQQELAERRKALETLTREVSNLKSVQTFMKQKMQNKERNITELQRSNEGLENERQMLLQDLQNLNQDKDDVGRNLKQAQEETRRALEEAKTTSRAKERMIKDSERVDKLKAEVERQRDFLRAEMSGVHKELEIQVGNANTDEKLIKDLQLQVKRLTSALSASKDKNRAHVDMVRQHQEMKKGLDSDILRHKKDEQKLRKKNYDLEKDREKASLSATSWHNKYQEAMEQIRMKELEIIELHKKVAEERNKLKIQQSLYENVRADRNLFSQQHIEAQDEIAEMSRKFKIMKHQIDQLKDEIAQKDQALIKQHFDVKALKEEQKSLRKQISKKDEILGSADKLLASQDVEIKNLRRTLQEAEQAQKQQKKVFDDVVDERDILGSQLIRRNDELALLYEKIKIQQSTLGKGELQYSERVEDIRMLRMKVGDLKRQLQIRNNQVANMEALKNEVYHLQRELLQERTKVKALSEELENPMNVHRWRKLEGSDPSAFEMLQKIHTLQKRLIQKTEQCVEKDLIIQEKEKLYVELKNILARQPGPEVAEQLSQYQQHLKEKTRQMKAMAAELNMFQAQVNEYKFEMERLTRELQDVKRKFYGQKRKEQLIRESTRPTHVDQDGHPVKHENGERPVGEEIADPHSQTIQAHGQVQQFQAAHTKFVGGGFALR